MKRLEYIDSLKGFAILLVVIGHVIPWSFASISSVMEMSPSPILLWKIIYSFHMPLFMFISGYLFGKSRFDSPGYLTKKLGQKTLMLILPYFVCGILVYLWRGGREMTYWYLLTLWQLIFITSIVNYGVERLKNKNLKIYLEILILICIYIGICLVPYFYDSPYLHIWYNWYAHLKDMFPYFAIGYLSMRYIKIESILNNIFYSLCLLIFCMGFFVEIPKFVQSLSAIYCCLFVFVEYFTSGPVISYFKRIGKKTLHIYILHLFWAIQIVEIGDFYILLAQGSRMQFVTSFVLQFLISGLMSFVIIELSLFSGKVICSSKLFSLFLLGEIPDVIKTKKQSETSITDNGIIPADVE